MEIAGSLDPAAAADEPAGAGRLSPPATFARGAVHRLSGAQGLLPAQIFSAAFGRVALRGPGGGRSGRLPRSLASQCEFASRAASAVVQSVIRVSRRNPVRSVFVGGG
ncbi:hypothetical protein GCM10009547_14880 [Sporichthya brevicatena]|uniref:Uncharacterized protein n=1 Tax=Sporichthya brevicatena TaxID=171442 RepID=A0ABN1GLK1_9ACTN